MKIDRGKVSHWLYLGLFTLNVLAALALRWLPWRRRPRTVVLYGHKLNGNLAALLAHARAAGGTELEFRFLTMDPAYHRRLLGEDQPSVLAISPRCIPLLARADALVTDHGLHSLQLLARCTRVALFDVWHGIPFKGFDADDFRPQLAYDEVWLPSPRVRTLYVERFGFEQARLQVTGYARTDPLVRPQEPLESLRDRLGLQRTRGHKLILFAPTWAQDAAGRSVFPFGTAADDFIAALDAACARAGAMVLFRTHLNSGAIAVPGDGRILAVPHADFPDTEAVLRLSDVLVCDWSSIAFDYLLLDRPTIFLDVAPPFAKGFSLGPEYRFGEIVGDLPALLAALARYLGDPGAYRREHGARADAIRAEVYGDFADGHAAARCLERLRRRLA